MKTHEFDYNDLTLDDIETLSIHFDYILDGDRQKIIVVEKEYLR